MNTLLTRVTTGRLLQAHARARQRGEAEAGGFEEAEGLVKANLKEDVVEDVDEEVRQTMTDGY